MNGSIYLSIDMHAKKMALRITIMFESSERVILKRSYRLCLLYHGYIQRIDMLHPTYSSWVLNRRFSYWYRVITVTSKHWSPVCKRIAFVLPLYLVLCVLKQCYTLSFISFQRLSLTRANKAHSTITSKTGAIVNSCNQRSSF